VSRVLLSAINDLGAPSGVLAASLDDLDVVLRRCHRAGRSCLTSPFYHRSHAITYGEIRSSNPAVPALPMASAPEKFARACLACHRESDRHRWTCVGPARSGRCPRRRRGRPAPRPGRPRAGSARSGCRVGGCPVRREVVLAAEQVVVHVGGVRLIDVQIHRIMPLGRFCRPRVVA